MIAIGVAIMVGPHGTAQGKAVYLGDPHGLHVYSRHWDDTLHRYTHAEVLFV